MFRAKILFFESGSQMYEQDCVIPSLPNKDDVIGVQGANIQPFKSGLGKVRAAIRTIYPDLLGTQNYALIIVDLVMTSQEMTINVEAIAL